MNLFIGPVLRNSCKLNKEKLKKILEKYKEINPIIIYLKSRKEDILERRKEDREDYSMLQEKFESLNNRYEQVMDLISNYLKVLEINTSEKSIEEMFRMMEKEINEYNICREYIER